MRCAPVNGATARFNLPPQYYSAFMDFTEGAA
jgi:hypothetical protein